MRKNPLTILSVAAVFCLTVIILLYPSICLYYALNGLNLWFQKMIPALFPFMVLSGIMIRMNLTESFTGLLSPILRPLFRVSHHCIYAIFIGFLCGFPMGAHVSASLYERKCVSKSEAEFLIAFCNNIGPVYFISFALPVIGVTNLAPALFGMYGIPLLYGLFLRHFCYHKATWGVISKENTVSQPLSFLAALDESVMSALTSITKLGGYMIIFNLLNVIPQLCFSNQTIKAITGCLLEITGGLTMLETKAPIIALCLLQFGGFSCMAQTYSMIQTTDLSLGRYFRHKLIITLICTVYYLFLGKISFSA